MACGLLGLSSPLSVWSQEEALPKQGAELLKTDILVVLAHPDDETGMASTLAYYAHGKGARIAHAYCTRGEGGGNMVGTHWGPSLGILRQAELQECLEKLGVKHCFFLGELDWAYTESVSMTFEKWEKESTLEELVRLVRNLRPEVILTMNPFPRPGQHGHHQAAGMLAVEAFSAAADPSRFPEQLKREGIQPWQARKLYFRGESVGAVARIDAGKPLPGGVNAHLIAGEALRNHRSQGFGRFRRASLGRPPETFGLIKAAMPIDADETDLLAGLPLDAGTIPRVPPPPPSPKRDLSMDFRPRPAVARFQSWAEEHAITHLVERLPSDLSLATGQANEIHLRLENHQDTVTPVQIAVEFGGDGDEDATGWRVLPPTLSETLGPHSEKTVTLRVTPPTNATQDIGILAKGRSGVGEWRATATLHPVPTAALRRLPFAPGLRGDGDSEWQLIDPLLVSAEQIVQGKNDGAADCSATVRLGYDDAFLYARVLVKDDVVVANIAPNDIRGHWRTDAVELCLDPSANSEHTLSCFKVGIFPFDLNGQARAARDADAQQGPIEETAPGMRLSSLRTSDGYQIDTAIPWEVIGLEAPPTGSVIGFNVILYDGDKADAAHGENINECRLAWAPRRGVQGRPEDWGRLVLK